MMQDENRKEKKQNLSPPAWCSKHKTKRYKERKEKVLLQTAAIKQGRVSKKRKNTQTKKQKKTKNEDKVDMKATATNIN